MFKVVTDKIIVNTNVTAQRIYKCSGLFSPHHPLLIEVYNQTPYIIDSLPVAKGLQFIAKHGYAVVIFQKL